MTPPAVSMLMTALVTEPRETGACYALLTFRVRAPMEVRVTLSDESGSITWLWGRELLAAAACGGSAGLGDVFMWFEDDALKVRLSALPSRTGNATCVLVLPLHDVQRFLARTHDLVPYGREAEYLDMDGELRALLDAGA